MIGRIRTDILEHFRRNVTIYLIILFALLTGIASGAFTAGSMGVEHKDGLSEYLYRFFHLSSGNNVNRGDIFRESLWQHIQMTVLLCILGIHFIGMPLILIIIGTRGFFIGFTIGFIVGTYGFGGFLFCLISILPQTVIYMPAILGMGVVSLESSINHFKRRKKSYSKGYVKHNTGTFLTKIFIFFIILLIGSLYEALIPPLFFRMFAGVFR